MTQSTSNLGELGIESIRIGGMKIDDLPIAENAQARPQIRLAEDTERQNKIKEILKSSPRQKIPYLDSRVKECQENIERMKLLKSSQQSIIDEYRGQLVLCKHRDKEIAKLDTKAKDYDDKIRELCKQFPVYNTTAMEQQIEQSEEAIQRAEEVIAKEFADIAKLQQLIVLCDARDKQLAKLGVKISPTNK